MWKLPLWVFPPTAFSAVLCSRCSRTCMTSFGNMPDAFLMKWRLHMCVPASTPFLAVFQSKYSRTCKTSSFKVTCLMPFWWCGGCICKFLLTSYVITNSVCAWLCHTSPTLCAQPCWKTASVGGCEGLSVNVFWHQMATPALCRQCFPALYWTTCYLTTSEGHCCKCCKCCPWKAGPPHKSTISLTALSAWLSLTHGASGPTNLNAAWPWISAQWDFSLCRTMCLLTTWRALLQVLQVVCL